MVEDVAIYIACDRSRDCLPAPQWNLPWVWSYTHRSSVRSLAASFLSFCFFQPELSGKNEHSPSPQCPRTPIRAERSRFQP